MPSRSISDLHPELAYAWGLASGRWERLYPFDPKPILTCTYRSPTEQNELYTQGRTKPGSIVTNAKGGESPHNYAPALALDVAFKDLLGNIDYSPRLFDQLAKLMPDTIVWGGQFKSMPDKPHFELLDWKHLAGINGPIPPPPPPSRVIKEGKNPPAPPPSKSR